jgi:hypothetical protein
VRRLVLVAAFAVALWAGLGLATAPGARAATWCGAGETSTDLPDVVTGPQVHAIVVAPADGADDFATLSGQLATDIATIDAWWQGQDPTRIVRFDQAAYPTCTAPDISFLRLPQPAAAFTNADTALETIISDLTAAGLANPWKIYLIYYDGPLVQSNICGTGGGEFDQGPGYATVWLHDCAGIPIDSIAAHEILHALGALPDGAPHACAVDQGGPAHPCDSTQDVLYPRAGGAPLSQLLLDAGHDDYYAHGGAWNDIQDSVWMHRLDLPQVTLSIAFQGAGTVTSDQPGLVCSATCSTQWDENALVRLNPAPATGMRFIGWTGACSGVTACDLMLATTESAVAVFGPTLVTVRASVSGKGKVVCTPACSTHFPAGTTLTMRAVPAKGWKFKAWTGVCKGKQPVCRLLPNYSEAAKATFVKVPVVKRRAKH